MKKLILVLIAAVFLISCTDNDDDVVNDAELLGTWSLNKAICFCFFGDDFDFSAHKLNFTPRKNIVIVENSEDTFFVKAAGEYSYKVEEAIITIDGSLEYAYEIKGDTLTLNYVDNPQIADDEITLIYTKD